MKQLGSIGDRVDLLVRVGTTFGPHRVTLTDAAGLPLGLTGATITAAVGSTPFTIVMLDAPGGEFEFSLPIAATSALVVQEHDWRMNVTWPDATVWPLFFGTLKAVS